MTIGHDLGEVLDEAARAHGVPGAAAAVLVDGEVHVATNGVTSVDHPLDVDAGTLFQVGSISKTVTSAAMMLLVEEGALALEDPVIRHLPHLASTGLDLEAITIETALSHQAGFDGDHLFVHRTGDLAHLASARRLFPPGQGFSYNNAAFSMAGAVVEAVSGTPFADFVVSRLFRPLGMATACFDADTAITHRVAMPHFVYEHKGYVIRNAGWQRGWELGPRDWAAGGLVASVQEVARWGRFQLDGLADDGSTLLSRDALQRLHTPVVTADARDRIALDWFVRDVDGVTTIGHGGVTAGYHSDLVVAPEPRVGIVALTHATNGGSVNQAVRRWALERFAGAVERDPEPDPALTVDPQRFEGRFEEGLRYVTLTAGDEPDTIVASSSAHEDPGQWQPPDDPPVTLRLFAEDHAVSVGASPARVARFGFADDGCVAWVLWGYRRAVRVG